MPQTDQHTVILGSRLPHERTSNPHSSSPLPAGARIEDFEIQSVIGHGGFGLVYRARDLSLERHIALKEYFPSNMVHRDEDGNVKLNEGADSSTFKVGLDSFINEARLLARFDHPSLVKVYRFWEDRGTAFMVMPLYEGQTLKQQVETHGPIQSPDELIKLIRPLAQALDCMHAQQCIHRDISPENIIIRPDGRPLLLDFGAARQTLGSLNPALTVILKVSYAPVEQYAEIPGMGQGAWTDVYALASVTHWAMTGEVPPSAMGRLVNDTYQPLCDRLPEWPKQITCAVDSALAVKPQDRTQSMQAFINALGAAPSSQPVRLSSEPIEGDDMASQSPQGVATFTLPQPEKPTDSIAKTTRLTLAPIKLAAVFIMFTLAVTGFVLWLLLGSGKKATEVSQTLKPEPAPISEETRPAPPPEPPPVQTAHLPKAQSTLIAESLPQYSVFAQVINGLTHGEELLVKPKASRLTIGKDRLKFTIESLLNGHVAVYVLSTDHQLIQLIPNKRSPDVFVKAGEPLDLPLDSDPIEVTGPEGTDEFLVIVSTQKRNYDALQMHDLYGFGLINRMNSNAENLIGKLKCQGQADCEDRYTAAWFKVQEVNP